MADTTFVANSTATPITAEWLNIINDFYYTDIRSGASTAVGAGLVGFDWDLNYAVDSVGWGLMTARYSYLKYVPVAEWAAIFAGTSTTDLTAYNALALAGESLITLPPGKMRGEWDLTAKRGKTIRGAGRDVTTLENVDNTAVFTLNNTGSDCKNNTFEDFKIDNRDEGTYTTCDGFVIDGNASNENDFHTFRRVDVFDMRRGWSILNRHVWGSWVECHAMSCVDGVYCVTTENVSALSFRQCRFGANTGYGMFLSKASGDPFFGWTLENVTMEKNASNGLRVSGAASGISGFTLIGGHFEENTTGVAASSTTPYKANIYVDAAQCVGLNIVGVPLLGTPLATALDWGVYISSTTCSGNVLACRPGTFTNGFVQVTAGVVIIGPQDGGSTTISGAGAFTMVGEQESSFTATLTGCTTSPTGEVTYLKQGSQVTLRIPGITATSNTTAATLTGIPTALRPTNTQDVILRTVDATAGTVIARGTINSSGVLTMFTDGSAGVFANSGTKGVAISTVTYYLD